MASLTASARRVLRHLDEEKTPTSRLPAVIGMAVGLRQDALQRAVDELVAQHLIEQHIGGWYDLTDAGREWLEEARQQGDTIIVGGDVGAGAAVGSGARVEAEAIAGGDVRSETRTDRPAQQPPYRLLLGGVALLLVAVAALIALAALGGGAGSDVTPTPRAPAILFISTPEPEAQVPGDGFEVNGWVNLIYQVARITLIDSEGTSLYEGLVAVGENGRFRASVRPGIAVTAMTRATLEVVVLYANGLPVTMQRVEVTLLPPA